MYPLDFVLSASALVLFLDAANAYPSARSHYLTNKQQQQRHKDQQKQVSALHGGRSSDLPINELRHQSPATAAEYPTSDVSMWEYNIFLDEPSNLQFEDYDYDSEYDVEQYDDDVDVDEGPTIQNLILLAATQPRRNRNVFGLPPREVVIY